MQAPLEDKWVMLEGAVDGVKCLIRARQSLPSIEFRNRNKFLMTLRWDYVPNARESGLPDGSSGQRIRDFEDVLFASTDADTWAIEVASITGEGVKEWRFFTSSPVTFLERIKQMFVGHGRYPLQINSIEDGEWFGLSELLAQ
jgi:Family of unknown function (DUF695)